MIRSSFFFQHPIIFHDAGIFFLDPCFPKFLENFQLGHQHNRPVYAPTKLPGIKGVIAAAAAVSGLGLILDNGTFYIPYVREGRRGRKGKEREGGKGGKEEREGRKEGKGGKEEREERGMGGEEGGGRNNGPL
jgi:hypothetical protein